MNNILKFLIFSLIGIIVGYSIIYLYNPGYINVFIIGLTFLTIAPIYLLFLIIYFLSYFIKLKSEQKIFNFYFWLTLFLEIGLAIYFIIKHPV